MQNSNNWNAPNNNSQEQPSELTDMITYRMMYPEIFYKLQPFIIMSCDQMESSGEPTQEMIEMMTENIHRDFCRMYPDLEEYARGQEMETVANPAVVEVQRPFRSRFRRRGLLRDIIEILLVSELFRRRRRYR
ncbi:MAG: hypothetical protein PHR18_07675 [Oscillospiraceae bacterium]|nr:hypothetical protein [Oscillospiraceae bacterium]MDD3833758.1 hypothetical protein [Oscillospiraceae bacterium]